MLLSSGLVDEAYERYGLTANRTGTYVSWFRTVSRKHPDKEASEILSDLVAITPGDEGKWLAAAKSAGLYDEALRLALRAPCDPRTLTRAARDFMETNPIRKMIATDAFGQRFVTEVLGQQLELP